MAQVVDKMSAEVRSAAFWRACLAEFIGTLLFIFLGLGSTVTKAPDLVRISLAFGLAIATLVHCTAHISGGHLNPAVTIGFLVTHAITPLRAIVYVFAQVLGGMVGAGILRGLSPSYWSGGPTVPQQGVEEWQAFIMEILLTFQLVFTVFSTVDPDRKGFAGSGPLAIGLSVGLGHLAAIEISSASMNPARSIASAIVSSNWTAHWAYWVGPILGGILAAGIYDIVLAPTADMNRLRKCATCVYDPSEEESRQDIDLSIINQGQAQDEPFAGGNKL
ncbi:lens fiber major intrinsic protein-like [Acanthaster planci]|uniref:Lens fiber major intrinsic protein-like n=1 Tax=Acanthaster planci TaxID=133434 RepID=A0A8B7XTD0_ACAPL|nr:lens fiber major intrinsic protein-like [Acanthaster planci]